MKVIPRQSRRMIRSGESKKRPSRGWAGGTFPCWLVIDFGWGLTDGTIDGWCQKSCPTWPKDLSDDVANSTGV